MMLKLVEQVRGVIKALQIVMMVFLAKRVSYVNLKELNILAKGPS